MLLRGLSNRLGLASSFAGACLLSVTGIGGLAVSTTKSFSQVSSISDLSDVSRQDFAFLELQKLADKYNCDISALLSENRVITRYEFAAVLHNCLKDKNILQEDVTVITQLQVDFAAELATLKLRTDSFVSDPVEQPTFSASTKLEAEVVFGLSEFDGPKQVFSTLFENAANNRRTAVPGVSDDSVFSYRGRLNFDTRFTGDDTLRTRQSGNNPSRSYGQNGLEIVFSGFEADATSHFPLIESMGDDFVILSPEGPAGGLGGGIRIPGFAVPGFADVQNAISTSEFMDYRIGARLFGETHVNLVSTGEGVTSFTPFIGVVGGSSESETSIWGQTAIFGGAPGLDFSSGSQIDDDYYGASIGGNWRMPLSVENGVTIALSAELEALLTVHNLEGSAHLTTTGSVNAFEMRHFDQTESNVSGSAYIELEAIGPQFEFSAGVGIDTKALAEIYLSPLGPASVGVNNEDVFVGRIRTTFKF